MKKYILGTLLMAMSFAANAQFNLGMHQFTGVPQSNYTNPALLPQSRFFIALPSVYVNYWNPTFVLDDIIKEVGDSSMLDFSKLYNERPGGTFGFNIEQQSELFQLGFRIKKKTFISFGVYQGLQTGVRLPVDLLRLAQEGTTSAYFQNNPISLDNIDLNIQSYVAYHMGFGREINKKLTVGGRVKLINGLVGTNTEYARGKIYWDSDSVRVTSDLRYNTAGFARLDQSLGIFGGDSVRNLATGFNVNEWFPTSGNTGLAFDFGFTYKPIKKLVLSFSATDLGSINWTQSLRSYVSEENEFTYEGGQITVGDESGDGPFDGITDSLLSGLNIQEEAGKAFTTRMNSRYIVSASYELLPNTFVGGIYSRNLYFNESFDAFTAFAQFKIWNILFLRGNYTVSQGTFDNLGGALAVKVGPLQIYTVADNLLALNNQGNVSSLNVRVGANLLFGMRKPKEKKEVPVDL